MLWCHFRYCGVTCSLACTICARTKRKTSLHALLASGAVGLIVLLLIDVVALVVELVLDSEYPSCDAAERICPVGFDPSLPCVDVPDAVSGTHLALFCLSCVILCLFLVEISMTVFALGVAFFKNPLYIMDAVVVTASLTIEIWAYTAAEGGNATQAKSVADVLIFVRLWRFVRIAHGIYSVAHETINEKELEIKELEEDVEELKRLLEHAHRDRLMDAGQRAMSSSKFVLLDSEARRMRSSTGVSLRTPGAPSSGGGSTNGANSDADDDDDDMIELSSAASEEPTFRLAKAPSKSGFSSPRGTLSEIVLPIKSALELPRKNTK